MRQAIQRFGLVDLNRFTPLGSVKINLEYFIFYVDFFGKIELSIESFTHSKAKSVRKIRNINN
jgi:hypothetical protein